MSNFQVPRILETRKYVRLAMRAMVKLARLRSLDILERNGGANETHGRN
jgi:hypothetical protein